MCPGKADSGAVASPGCRDGCPAPDSPCPEPGMGTRPTDRAECLPDAAASCTPGKGIPGSRRPLSLP